MAKGQRRIPHLGWVQLAPLVPLALFASAFTVSATGDTGTTGDVPVAAPARAFTREAPVVVPRQPIPGPVNIPVPGTVGPGIARGQKPAQVMSGLSRNGIPEVALAAYSRAQQVMSRVDPGCHLPWTLVAAIGRVESDHGRYGGNKLNDAGVAVPGILGPRLDGRSTARISDSDAGRLDGDTAFDRAVGPMQFIPGTWRSMGVDGDGDGSRNPQDIDDAALAAAVYLCSGDTDLSRPGDLNQALLRYNRSQPYADLVTGIAKAYASGNWTAVGDGRNDNRADGKPGDPDTDTDRATGWDLPQARKVPTQPGRVTPDSARPTTDPVRPRTPAASTPPDEATRSTAPGTDQPSAPPSSSSTTTPPVSQPPTTTPPTTTPPTTKPTTKPPRQSPATLTTTVGIIVGSADSTVTELRAAVRYCQAELTAASIAAPTRSQLQQCVTAYQNGGPTAVDQVVRGLVSLLRPLGILGGGLLGG